MPTYEYICVDCANKVEVVQSFTDPPLEVCVVCGGRLRKVFHAVGIQLKGGGFYSSERRAAQPMSRARDKDSAKGDRKSEGADSSESKSSEKAASRSGDSKSDSKSESNSESKSSGERAKSKSEKSA